MSDAPWRPLPAELRAQGPAGKRFVRELLDRHELTPGEGTVALEVAHALSSLDAVRGLSRRGKSLRDAVMLEKLEMAWSKHVALLLGQLKVTK